MDRRQFLGAAAGAGAIGWLGHYFFDRPAWAGDDTAKDAITAMGDVAEAYRRAYDLGKPLLVLVIPTNDEQKRGRGHVFGEALNHGGQGLYLDLALCEIVCAPVAQVSKQLKDTKVEGEPLLLLVETDGATARVVPIDADVPYQDAVLSEGAEKADEAAKQRVEKLSAALRKAVAPSREVLASRAALAEKRLPPEDVQFLHNVIAAKVRWTDKDLDRGAAIVRFAWEDPARPNPALLEHLAAAAEKRVTGSPPPGAKWAKESGCGTEVEGGTTEAVACGMGYVPKISQRFLWFFTKKP
jgi:hypothetical protein